MAPSRNSTRVNFTNQFKLKAVEIAEQIGDRAAAKQLRISDCNVRRWRHQKVVAISQAPRTSVVPRQRMGPSFHRQRHNLKEKNDVVDDLTTDDDPYEDKIPLTEWEELFNGQVFRED